MRRVTGRRSVTLPRLHRPLIPANAGPPPPDANADQDALVILDSIMPGGRAAILGLRAALRAEPDRARTTIAHYRETAARVAGELAEQRLLEDEHREEARETLEHMNRADMAFSAIGAIPFVGSIAKGVWDLIRRFVAAQAQAEALGGTIWRPMILEGEESFFGWTQGDFWAMNLPILSFLAPFQVSQHLARTQDVYRLELRALSRLALALPFGCAVPHVGITSSGQYSYRFNWRGTNDFSDRAQQQGEIYWLDVWDPADITATGPREFDVSAPRAWYQRAKVEALAKRAPRQRGRRL